MFSFLRGLFGGGKGEEEEELRAFERFSGAEAQGEQPVFGALTAPAIAEKIAQLVETSADSEAIAETYAAFERAYPRTALPKSAQLQVARLLGQTRRRLLAVEAQRKLLRDGSLTSEERAAAQFALAELLAQSPACGTEALQLLKQIQNNPQWAVYCGAQAAEAQERIARELDEIHPPGPPGAAPWPPAGRCRILAQTLARFPIPKVGSLLAARLGRRLIDVNARLSNAPGLLGDGLTPEAAESLARELQAMGVPVVVAAEADCPPLPPAEIAAEILLMEDGGFVVRTALGGEMQFDPADVAHAQFAILRSKRFERGESRAVASPYGSLDYREPDRQEEERHRLCDLYFFDPPRRIRLMEGRTPIGAILPSRPTLPQPTFTALLKRVLRDAVRIPLNHTLDALFSDASFDLVTFDSEQAFENRAVWLFWLAYNRALGE